MMNQRIRVASALLLTTLSVAGCGNRPTGYSRAYGKLTYKGQPAAGAFLVFQLDGGKPQSADTAVPAATVADDGSFELTCANGDGAPPGKYKVLVAWPTDPSADAAPAGSKTKTKEKSRRENDRRKNKEDTLTRDRFKGRYYSTDHPLTVVEVKAEPTDLGSLEVKDP
jgi:hypothetical protein